MSASLTLRFAHDLFIAIAYAPHTEVEEYLFPAETQQSGNGFLCKNKTIIPFVVLLQSWHQRYSDHCIGQVSFVSEESNLLDVAFYLVK